MPATALPSETAALRATIRTETSEAVRSSQRCTPSGPRGNLDEFAAAWESRSTRAERDRLNASPDTEDRHAEEPPLEPVPASSGQETRAKTLLIKETFGKETLRTETLCSWTLGEFGASGLAIKVESSVLDDTIWLLSEPEGAGDETMDTKEDESMESARQRLEDETPVYRHSELEGLLGLDARPLRNLHRLKRAFGVRFEITGNRSAHEPLTKAPEEIPLEWLESNETLNAADPSGEVALDDMPSRTEERTGA